MKSSYKKEDILHYFKNYYKIHTKSPVSKDKSLPFSDKLVCKYYGSWSNALVEAGLPLNRNGKVIVSCTHCSKEYKKGHYEFKRFKNHFCSSSCCATYNNKRRTTGFKVSKLEVYLQEHLQKGRHSSLTFSFNDRNVCDGYELDIYIPSLLLGFEINGIFHYKPIFGQEKLDNIIRKDLAKNIICKNKNIHLITIKDTSTKFSEKYGISILNTINGYIDDHITNTLVDKQ